VLISNSNTTLIAFVWMSARSLRFYTRNVLYLLFYNFLGCEIKWELIISKKLEIKVTSAGEKMNERERYFIMVFSVISPIIQLAKIYGSISLLNFWHWWQNLLHNLCRKFSRVTGEFRFVALEMFPPLDASPPSYFNVRLVMKLVGWSGNRTRQLISKTWSDE
jgi:hypothetical protein